MSDVYTGFYVRVESIDTAGVLFLREALGYFEALGENGFADSDALNPYEVRRLKAFHKDYWGTVSLTTEPHERSVTLWSEDRGSPDLAAVLLQLYLRRAHPEGFFAFEVGYFGDVYGGAAYFVTAKRISVFSTDLWLERQKARYAKAAL